MNSLFNVHTVASYLHHINDDEELSPIRLQSGLYFLFAYYGSVYPTIDSKKYPKYLFDATFEAWKYGSVIKKVHENSKQELYSLTKIQKAVNEIESNTEIAHFIQDTFAQIKSISDFELIHRNYQDEVWQNAYCNKTEINKDDIINEYKTKYT